MAKDRNKKEDNKSNDLNPNPVQMEVEIGTSGISTALGLTKTAMEKATEWAARTTPEPLIAYILKSGLKDNRHHVKLVLKNNWYHGIYIENFTVNLQQSTGTNSKKEFAIVNKPQDSNKVSALYSEDEEFTVEEFFPLYVKPNGNEEFWITFDICDIKEFKSKPYGTAKFDCSILDLKDVIGASLIFRIRWDPI